MSAVNDELPDRVSIESPADFEGFLSYLHGLLRDGVVAQSDSRKTASPHVLVKHIPPAGPWPDVVDSEFETTDGRRYHLFVETYHGAGGEWRRTEETGST